MSSKEQTASRPRVLILGATGRIGSKVIAELERINTVRVVYSSRKLAQVEAWRRDGKDEKPDGRCEGAAERRSGSACVARASSCPTSWP